MKKLILAGLIAAACATPALAALTEGATSILRRYRRNFEARYRFGSKPRRTGKSALA